METTPRFYQLSLRTLFEIVAAIAVVLAFSYQRVQTKARYQMLSTPRIGGGSEVFMYDTATGKVWSQQYDGTWTAPTLPGLTK